MSLTFHADGGTVLTAGGYDNYDGVFRVTIPIREVGPSVNFILAHPVPSTGDRGDKDTVRCCELATRWGVARVVITFINPHRVRLHQDLAKFPPAAYHRKPHLDILRGEAQQVRYVTPKTIVVAAWGEGGRMHGAADSFLRWMAGGGSYSARPFLRPYPLHALGYTPGGDPLPVLDAASDVAPQEFDLTLYRPVR